LWIIMISAYDWKMGKLELWRGNDFWYAKAICVWIGTRLVKIGWKRNSTSLLSKTELVITGCWLVWGLPRQLQKFVHITVTFLLFSVQFAQFTFQPSSYIEYTCNAIIFSLYLLKYNTFFFAGRGSCIFPGR